MSDVWAPLANYLPSHALPLLRPYLEAYPTHIKVVRPRKTKLGDYRRPVGGHASHRITINSDLEPHQFLITIVHELAHLHAFQLYGYNIKPHGDSWKTTYVDMLKPFVSILNDEAKNAVLKEIKHPRATTVHPDFHKQLEEKKRNGGVLVNELSAGDVFVTDRGQRMQAIRPLRTYVLCKEIPTKRLYRVHGQAVVHRDT